MLVCSGAGETGEGIADGPGRVGDHGEIIGAVLAVLDAQAAGDHVGVGGEVLVEVGRPVGGVHGDDGLKYGAVGGLFGGAAPENENVGDYVGAGRGPEGAGRQADGTDQVGPGGHVRPGGGVGAVEGEPGGHHRHQPSGSDQVERFDDEMVVEAVAMRVVAAVVQGDSTEGDVADHEVLAGVGQVGVGEGLGPDAGGGVEGLGDGGGGRVEFDADDVHAGRGEADEVAGPATGLEHPGAVGFEAELADGGPQQGDDLGGGVVGVDGGAPCRAPLRFGEQAGQFVAGCRMGGGVGVEDVGYRPPAGPAGQDGLFGRGGSPLVGLEPAQQPQRLQVGAQLGGGAGGGQVVLTARPEDRGRVAVRVGGLV